MRAIPAVLGLLLLAALALAISFTSPPQINSGATVFTDDDLVCSWTASGDVNEVNVTWYLSGVAYYNEYDNSSPYISSSTIPSSNTSKNQGWRCTVILGNGSDTTQQSTNITVQNSAPTSPVVYNATGDDIGTTYNITEDVAYSFDANSTDLDSDTLLYYFKAASFCTVSDSATGATTCTPTHSYISSGNETEYVTQVNVTWWVDDDDPIFAKSASTKIAFNITPVNDAPSVTVADQSVDVDATFNQTFAASDEEEDYPLSVTVLNTTDSEIYPDVAAGIEGNATLRITYFTNPVDYNDVGNWSVFLNLTDARNESVTVNFTLEILSVNRAPYFVEFDPWNLSSSLNRTYVIAQGDTLIINVTANDPETNVSDQNLTFSDDTSLFAIATVNPTATNVSDALGRINFTATNDDVGNATVTITVTDAQSGQNTTTINITVTNVNDAPTLLNQSYDAQNTNANVNITPLIAYIGAPFYYRVNASDPDEQYGDTLTFTDNTSTVNITSSGVINFTPSGIARNETINITVLDAAGLNDSRSVILEIRDNSPPYFNDTFPDTTCPEGQACTFNVSFYAKEDDPTDNISEYTYSFTSGSLPSFSLDNATGLISFTPDQSEIGDYVVLLTIEDTRGATASQSLNLSVTNTEDYPVWERYDFSNETIVEGKAFTYQLRASDQDLLLGSELLAFTSNLSWVNITYQGYSNDTATALLSITANSSQVGTHSITLNVTDNASQTNSTTITFTVLGDTDPPNITYIKPYGNDSDSDAIVDDWLDVTNASVAVEDIVFDENSSYTFQVNATDDVTAASNLTYTWEYDGTQVATTQSYTRSFGFFSSGTHNLSVRVNDTTLESTLWTFNLSVTDVNRAPVLLGNFTGSKNDLNITTALTFNDYFVYAASTGGFYDADDDTDEDGLIDPNETLSLTYTATTCSVATIEQSGNSLLITPESVGSCSVTFNASDVSGASVVSNVVNIDVTQVPNTTTVVTTSSSGGGGSSSRSTFVPFPQEVETPHPLSLITPEPVSIYENATVSIPLELHNNWTQSIDGIYLSGVTNASNVEIAFDRSYIDQLDPNETARIMMTVFGYRLGESFEINAVANSTDPVFSDTALILFSSIERAEEGKEASVKVTFARDLLSQNDECKELNEILSRAESEFSSGNARGANELLDAVINGCQYLITRTEANVQRPGVVRLPFFELSEAQFRLASYFSVGLMVLLFVGGFVYYFYTREEYGF